METAALPRPAEAQACPAEAQAPGPRLAPGTELLGEYQGSAFEQPKYLVQRADGQVMQLPRLLYRVTGSLDGRSAEQIAADLSAETGQQLTGEQISFLVEDRLRPVGLIAADSAEDGQADGRTGPELPVKSDLLLALRYRVGVIPAEVAGRIARVFAPLFARPVWMSLVAAFVAVDAWILARGDLLGTALSGVQQLVHRPALILLIVALTVVSGAFHEFGHISACRYGGARPGDVGIGLYIVWPAFYSTVTDSYRLSRTGRLRTDLGGVYFDAIFMAVLGLVYLRTGQPWLLLALAGMLAETTWQFLPSIRLDGYYILADLIGVPDLFGYVRPALLSALPGRSTHPKVRELKNRARRIIVAWVFLVVPTLLVSAVAFLVLLPRAIPVAVQALRDYLHTLGAAARAGDLVTTSLGVLQIIFLLLPWVGSVLMLWWLVRALARWADSRWGDRARVAWVHPAAWAAARRRIVLPSLVGLGSLLVLRVAGVASSHPATARETRLVDSALAAARGIRGGPEAGPGEFLAREQLAGYARLTGAFDRHATVLDAGRELAVLATAVLVVSFLALVVTRGVRPMAAALPLLACLVMGPVVTTLATAGPGVLAVAWCAAGAALLACARGRVAVAVGATAIAVGVATAPLTTPPLAAGMALVVTGAPGGSTSRQARPKPPAAGARRWVSVLLVLFAGGLAVDLLADGPGGPGGPLHGSEQAVLLLLGGLVIVPALVVRNLRAPAVAAAAAVVVAALPLTGAGDALPLVIALVALLAALLVDHVARQPVSARPHPLLRAAIVIPVLVMVVVGALFSPRGVAERPHADLARWLVAPEARGGVLAVSPGLWGDLLRDGVPPGRLVEAGTPDAGRADWVVRSGAAAAGVEPTEQFRSGAGALTVQPSDAALARSRVAIDIQRSAEEARQRQAEADRDERRLVGGLLARSPGVEAPPEVRAALADGAVDMGALRALAALTAGWHDLRVGPLPAPAGTSAAPATSLVLTSFDGLPATLPDVVATIDALSGDAAAAEHVVDRSGLLLSWPPQGRAGALRFQVPT